MCDSEYYRQPRKRDEKASGKQLVSAVVGECELYALRRWNGYDSRFLRSGKWSLVNDDVLKISDFYGETMTLKIDDLDDQWLVVYEMENGQQSEEKLHSGTQRKAHRRSVQNFEVRRRNYV